MEVVLRDGLKVKRSVMGPSKDFFAVVEASVDCFITMIVFSLMHRSAEKVNATTAELCHSVRACAAKTYLGKARAFIRLALMQACGGGVDDDDDDADLYVSEIVI